MISISWCCNLGEHLACKSKKEDCECDCHGFEPEWEPD
jgi:hypothetical protein